jgi:hypothetical protein
MLQITVRLGQCRYPLGTGTGKIQSRRRRSTSPFVVVVVVLLRHVAVRRLSLSLLPFVVADTNTLSLLETDAVVSLSVGLRDRRVELLTVTHGGTCASPQIAAQQPKNHKHIAMRCVSLSVVRCEERKITPPRLSAALMCFRRQRISRASRSFLCGRNVGMTSVR